MPRSFCADICELLCSDTDSILLCLSCVNTVLVEIFAAW